MKTIEVVPRRFYEHPTTGQTCSFYGNCPPGYVTRTRGYTWRKIDARGSITVGLCRQPAKTREEADAIAREFAAKFGYRVVNSLDPNASK